MKILMIFLFLYANIFAIYEDYFAFDRKITLQKDKYYSKKISRKLIKKDLHIKWTLYTNNLLTIQVNYDKFNHQFNLKKSHNQQTFKLPLFRKVGFDVENPYLIIKFLEYKKYNNKDKNEVIFQLLVRDPSLTIRILDKEQKNDTK